MSTRSELIPDYIEAQSPRGLRTLMIETNANGGMEYQYFDIQTYVSKTGKTKWIAWFFRSIEDKDFRSE